MLLVALVASVLGSSTLVLLLVQLVFALTVVAEQSPVDEFAQHFRCPFAHVWLKHGPEGAARVLGIEPHELPLNNTNMATRIAVPRCSLAPGVIGGAHQHGLSPGYSNDCPDAPARGSPYMWPLRWKAQLEGKWIPFGTNKPSRLSKSTEWFRFDKNWKRGDMYSSKGNSTVLQRGQRMVFLKWSNEVGSNITNCTVMNMSVIGNIRPDWFLDKRGAAPIDVQYLGKEFIYYLGEPRLVRKWRKNHMDNRYFTISIDELTGSEGIHWPLVLNVPADIHGPDLLQQYSNHEVLTEDDEAPFLLDEAYMKAGGSCKAAGHHGGHGHPWPHRTPPSELKKDVNAWRSIEWTGKPSASSDTDQRITQGTSHANEIAFV